MPPTSLARLLVVGGLFSVMTLTLLLKNPDLAQHIGPRLLQQPMAVSSCRGWDPHGDPSDDPPNCLRARQLRQLQQVIVDGEPQFNDAAWSMIYHAERCILGVVRCPERPIIFTDYWYFYTYEHSSSGEGIWGDPIIATLKDMNFAVIGANHGAGHLAMWNITRKLSESIHAYWTDEDTTIRCLTDPRCVRPQDYREAEDPELRHNLAALPRDQVGTLEAWRLHTTTFWGARPADHCGNGAVSSAWYGMTSGPGEEQFSYHALGNKWHLTPYAYPGHTHIPMSIERSCLSSVTTPASEREDAVMILAKKSSFFNSHVHYMLHPELWETILDEVPQKFWTVANEENGNPIPEGIEKFQQMTRAAYGKKVSSAKAMVGIGQPMISPSPYTALCRGVPVLIPYWAELPENRRDWGWFSSKYSQHSQAISLGEPYVYGYNITDPHDLVRQLKKAVATPIKPFIPEEMKLANVRKRVEEVVFFDWEGEYTKIIEEKGEFPRHPRIVIEKTAERAKGDGRAPPLLQ